MTSWHLPRTLLATGAVLSALLVPAPAHALLGVDAKAGAGIQATSGLGLALNAEAHVGVLGWGVRGHYWQRLFSNSQLSWMAATVGKNVSPVPMINVSPGVGVAGLGQGATTLGPLGTIHASFSPVLLPVSVEASVGAAWLGGTSLVLPYSVGAKVSLIPFTGVTLRYRGFEGNNALLSGANGPELGVEVGI